MRTKEVCRALKHKFGFLFDIDGVITRGRNVLPAAREAFKMLCDSQGRFRVPVVFVTNAGNSFRYQKSQQLSEWLGVQVHEDQIVMSHSPLRMFKQFHSVNVLVSGQGPCIEIARHTGFNKLVTIDHVRDSFPMLDTVDHKRRRMAPCGFEEYFPKIDAVVLFGEPVRWETNLQLIVDVLMTNGQPNSKVRDIPYPHLPVLACNMDLVWMAEAKMPRFGHGSFLVCLEALYKKLSGRDLIYTAHIGKPSEITYQYAEQVLGDTARSMGWETPVEHIYCVGDNPETDICGANLYNQYLQRKRDHKMLKQKKKQMQVQSTSGHQIKLKEKELDLLDEISDDETEVFPKFCESILVTTGVFSDGGKEEHFNYAHRDFNIDTVMKRPSYITKNICEAVKLVYEHEDFL